MNTLLFLSTQIIYLLPFFFFKSKIKGLRSSLIAIGIILFQEPVLVNSLGSFLFSPIAFSAPENYYNLIFVLIISIINLFIFKVLISYSHRKLNFELHSNKIFSVSNQTVKIFLFLTISSWLILFLSSENWLYYPRLAYQQDRKSIGFIWSLYMSFSGLYVVLLYLRKRKLLLPIIYTIIFAHFSGSKGYLVFGPLKLIFLHLLIYNRKINLRVIFLSLVSLVSVSYIILVYNYRLDNTDLSTVQKISENYFTETANANLVFYDYMNGSLEYSNGEMHFSSFWKYLPRAVFPEKPFTYGSSRLVDVYFPGISERGTPSFGSSTYLFHDFGWFGSVVAALKFENIITIFSFCLSMFFFKEKIFRNKKLFLLSLIFISPNFGAQMPIIMKMIFLIIISKFIKIENYSYNTR